MKWKKLVNSKDVIVLEKELKKHKLKIEARRKDENSWEVFKTKIKGNTATLISEHILESKNQAMKLIESLKKTNFSLSQLYPGKNISLRRVFKEDYVEKWLFYVGKAKINNLIFVKYDAKINVDIVLHQSLRIAEKRLIEKIQESLGLRDMAEDIVYNIYYFNSSKTIKKASEPLSEYNIEMGFGFFDEEG